ncbi:hypothetical protein EG68_01630 [Paragonimus skrjabini miyazakii]|uniref:Uncharacterized protein n=1 Tax=Paragonimus skrjabini miyazakii TaxID=59628 RepID=A0A8S9Z3X0_9TREM|nr:hypothetical protein EG68_01630 [Paragonimus skrjabini miyazakii]
MLFRSEFTDHHKYRSGLPGQTDCLIAWCTLTAQSTSSYLASISY